MKKQQYGFITAISMVVGIVIGSGIFFKADDILTATNGSVKLGVLGFLLVGVGVLFGSLVISEYAINNPREGGVIPFAKDAFGPKVAFFVSWFMIVVYFPALIVILGYVTSIYIGVLFNLSSPLFLYSCSALVLAFAFITNILSKSLGGKIQSLATGLKLLPLLLIGVMGLTMSGDASSLASASDLVGGGNGFVTALIAIAFTFDGWIIVTSIGNEIKNPNKVLPIALTLGVVVTTVIYVLYFIGITNIVEPSQIMMVGDAHVDTAAMSVFGNYGSTIVTIFVIIAVYGGVNGMVLAYLRLPHAIVKQGLMKDILNVDDNIGNTGFSKGVVLFDIVVIAIIFVIQILISNQVIFANLEVPFDISTLPITLIYIIYIGLYLRVFRVTKRTGARKISLLIFVILATTISIVVIYGALQVNGLLYILISLAIVACGYPFLNKQ